MICLTIEDVCKWLGLRTGENPFPRIFREMGWPVEAVDLRQRITPKVAVELVDMWLSVED